jgi:hypothetical protein
MVDYREIARNAARQNNLDEDIFIRQINQESGFNPTAKSPVGAYGIAQIMPATAKSWGVDPTDPVASLNAAAKNMASYVNTYKKQGDDDNTAYAKALAAYNAGPGAVSKYKGVPPYKETQNYVKTILGTKTNIKPYPTSAPTESEVQTFTEIRRNPYDPNRVKQSMEAKGLGFAWSPEMQAREEQLAKDINANLVTKIPNSNLPKLNLPDIQPQSQPTQTPTVGSDEVNPYIQAAKTNSELGKFSSEQDLNEVTASVVSGAQPKPSSETSGVLQSFQDFNRNHPLLSGGLKTVLSIGATIGGGFVGAIAGGGVASIPVGALGAGLGNTAFSSWYSKLAGDEYDPKDAVLDFTSAGLGVGVGGAVGQVLKGGAKVGLGLKVAATVSGNVDDIVRGTQAFQKLTPVGKVATNILVTGTSNVVSDQILTNVINNSAIPGAQNEANPLQSFIFGGAIGGTIQTHSEFSTSHALKQLTQLKTPNADLPPSSILPNTYVIPDTDAINHARNVEVANQTRLQRPDIAQLEPDAIQSNITRIDQSINEKSLASPTDPRSKFLKKNLDAVISAEDGVRKAQEAIIARQEQVRQFREGRTPGKSYGKSEAIDAKTEAKLQVKLNEAQANLVEVRDNLHGFYKAQLGDGIDVTALESQHRAQLTSETKAPGTPKKAPAIPDASAEVLERSLLEAELTGRQSEQALLNNEQARSQPEIVNANGLIQNLFKVKPDDIKQIAEIAPTNKQDAQTLGAIDDYLKDLTNIQGADRSFVSNLVTALNNNNKAKGLTRADVIGMLRNLPDDNADKVIAASTLRLMTGAYPKFNASPELQAQVSKINPDLFKFEDGTVQPNGIGTLSPEQGLFSESLRQSRQTLSSLIRNTEDLNILDTLANNDSYHFAKHQKYAEVKAKITEDLSKTLVGNKNFDAASVEGTANVATSLVFKIAKRQNISVDEALGKLMFTGKSVEGLYQTVVEASEEALRAINNDWNAYNLTKSKGKLQKLLLNLNKEFNAQIIMSGELPSNAQGLYDPRNNTVTIKPGREAAATTHELAHEFNYVLQNNPELVNQLDRSIGPILSAFPNTQKQFLTYFNTTLKGLENNGYSGNAAVNLARAITHQEIHSEYINYKQAGQAPVYPHARALINELVKYPELKAEFETAYIKPIDEAFSASKVEVIPPTQILDIYSKAIVDGINSGLVVSPLYQKVKDIQGLKANEKGNSNYELTNYASDYTKALNKWTPGVWSEMSLAKFEILKDGNRSEFWATNNKDLALGQGNNKGIKVELASDGFDAQTNKKPGLEATDSAEFIVKPTWDSGTFNKNIKSIEVDFDYFKKTEDARGLNKVKLLMYSLEKEGWVKNKDGGMRIFTKKDTNNSDIRFQKNEKVLGAFNPTSGEIYLSKDANAFTVVHELAHWYESSLLDSERSQILKWAGHSTWTTNTSEKFARGFEKYMATKKAPVPFLKSVFKAFSQWGEDLLRGTFGARLESEKIDSRIQKVYDSMFSEASPRTFIAKQKVDRITAELKTAPTYEAKAAIEEQLVEAKARLRIAEAADTLERNFDITISPEGFFKPSSPNYNAMNLDFVERGEHFLNKVSEAAHPGDFVDFTTGLRTTTTQIIQQVHMFEDRFKQESLKLATKLESSKNITTDSIIKDHPELADAIVQKKAMNEALVQLEALRTAGFKKSISTEWQIVQSLITDRYKQMSADSSEVRRVVDLAMKKQLDPEYEGNQQSKDVSVVKYLQNYLTSSTINSNIGQRSLIGGLTRPLKKIVDTMRLQSEEILGVSPIEHLMNRHNWNLMGALLDYKKSAALKLSAKGVEHMLSVAGYTGLNPAMARSRIVQTADSINTAIQASIIGTQNLNALQAALNNLQQNIFQRPEIASESVTRLSPEEHNTLARWGFKVFDWDAMSKGDFANGFSNWSPLGSGSFSGFGERDFTSTIPMGKIQSGKLDADPIIRFSNGIREAGLMSMRLATAYGQQHMAENAFNAAKQHIAENKMSASEDTLKATFNYFYSKMADEGKAGIRAFVAPAFVGDAALVDPRAWGISMDRFIESLWGEDNIGGNVAVNAGRKLLAGVLGTTKAMSTRYTGWYADESAKQVANLGLLKSAIDKAPDTNTKLKILGTGLSILAIQGSLLGPNSFAVVAPMIAVYNVLAGLATGEKQDPDWAEYSLFTAAYPGWKQDGFQRISASKTSFNPSSIASIILTNRDPIRLATTAGHILSGNAPMAQSEFKQTIYGTQLKVLQEVYAGFANLSNDNGTPMPDKVLDLGTALLKLINYGAGNSVKKGLALEHGMLQVPGKSKPSEIVSYNAAGYNMSQATLDAYQKNMFIKTQFIVANTIMGMGFKEVEDMNRERSMEFAAEDPLMQVGIELQN